MVDMIWQNPELLEALKQRLAAGKSASIIANELGDLYNISISRNAVIGATHRYAKDCERPVPQPRPARIRRKKPKHPPVFPVEPIIELKETPPGTGIPFAELNRSMCRWPLGEALQPSTLFCGQPAQYPYCKHHRIMSHRQW